MTFFELFLFTFMSNFALFTLFFVPFPSFYLHFLPLFCPLSLLLIPHYSLSSDGELDDDDGPSGTAANDDADAEDGFVVPAGYLSDDEVIGDDEDGEGKSAEERAEALKVSKRAADASQQRRVRIILVNFGVFLGVFVGNFAFFGCFFIILCCFFVTFYDFFLFFLHFSSFSFHFSSYFSHFLTISIEKTRATCPYHCRPLFRNNRRSFSTNHSRRNGRVHSAKRPWPAFRSRAIRRSIAGK